MHFFRRNNLFSAWRRAYRNWRPLAAGVLACTLYLGIGGCSSDSDTTVNTSPSPSPTVTKLPALQGEGMPLPELTVEGSKGEAIALKSSEQKVTLVSLWSPTWFTDSRTQITELIKTYQKWNQRGLRIVGVAYDVNAKDLQRAVTDSSIPFEMGTGDKDLYAALKVECIPTYWIIGVDGSVLATLEGFQTEASLSSALESLCLSAQQGISSSQTGDPLDKKE